MKGARAAALAVVAMGCAAAASGLGVPYRVTNLNEAAPLPGNIGFLAELSGRAVVLRLGHGTDADGLAHSQMELWVGDPTNGESEPIAAWVRYVSHGPRLLGEIGGRLILQLDDFQPPWTSDGTRAGTRLLSPDFPVTGPELAHTRMGDRLLLAASDGSVWSTDGTPAGTAGLGIPFPGSDPLVTLGESGYYVSNPRIYGTDGTPAGSRMVTEFPDGFVTGLVATADLMYFVHRTSSGDELWASDGSPAGTRLVRRFSPAPTGTWIGLPMSLGHGVVFLECPRIGVKCHLGREGVPGASGDDRLSGDDLFSGSSAALHTDGSGLLFADGFGHLWRTDGTSAGTAALGRCAGKCLDGSGWQAPFPIARAGNRTVFSAPAAFDARQVWVTDGTDAGTRPLDAECAARDGCATELAVLSGDAALLDVSGFGPQKREVARLDAPAVSPVSAVAETGPAVASGDGFLVAGNLLVHLAADGSVVASMSLPGGRDGDADPGSVVALGSHVVFTACDGQQRHVYWTDGTPGDSVALEDGPDSCYTNLQAVPPVRLGGDAVIVDARDKMVRVDATGNAVTVLDRGATAMVRTGNGLTFLVPHWEPTDDGPLHNRLLTKLFVTPNGAAPASEVATLPFDALGETVVDGDRLLVVAREGVFALRPSTGAFEPIRCQACEICRGEELAILGDTPYLLGDHLWHIRDDTGRRVTPRSGGVPLVPIYGDLVAFDHALWFLAISEVDDQTWLVRSDGTRAGTMALAPIGEPYSVTTFRPVGLGHQLFFTVGTLDSREELWVSDGTAAGTHLFLDPQESPASAPPLLLGVAAGRLFFAADDGVHGVELWSTDGRPENTAMVADIAPGPLSAWPGRPVLAGGKLYFAAEDGATGRELWALPLAP